eukprot:1148133-Pelagomonas_calceolata.AAC.1
MLEALLCACDTKKKPGHTLFSPSFLHILPHTTPGHPSSKQTLGHPALFSCSLTYPKSAICVQKRRQTAEARMLVSNDKPKARLLRSYGTPEAESSDKNISESWQTEGRNVRKLWDTRGKQQWQAYQGIMINQRQKCWEAMGHQRQAAVARIPVRHGKPERAFYPTCMEICYFHEFMSMVNPATSVLQRTVSCGKVCRTYHSLHAHAHAHAHTHTHARTHTPCSSRPCPPCLSWPA